MPKPAVHGLTGNLALWRLLALKGEATPLQALDESLLFDFSAESLIQELGRHKMEARLVLLQAGDLAYLAFPTLVQAHSGHWIVLRKRHRGGYQIDTGTQACQWVGTGDLEACLSGLGLDLAKPLPTSGSFWLRMARLLPEYQQPLLLGMALALLGQGLALAAPFLTGLALDHALPEAAPSLVRILCLGLIGTGLCRIWVGWLKETALLTVSLRFEGRVEKGLFEHILWLPFQHLQGMSLGERLQAFSGLADARELLVKEGLSVVTGCFTLALSLICMTLIMPGPAGLVMVAALGTTLLTLLVGRLQSHEQQKAVQAIQAENAALSEVLSGAVTLKATGCQAWAFNRWRAQHSRGLAHNLCAERTGLWAEVGNEGLNQGLAIAILIWGGHRVLAGDLTLGSLIAFTQLGTGFAETLSAQARTAMRFIGMRPHLRSVEEAFHHQRLPRPPRRSLQESPATVVASRVWFRYGPNRPWILKGAQLDLAPGAFWQLGGPSGSGKTTLLKLLAGLYVPDKGTIVIGGLDPQAAGDLVAFLPQFPQLHSGSLLENLKFFSGGAPPVHLIEVARETGLDDWIGTLPMGYQTLVSSGGANLSGGQRQWLTLTAVLASPKRILLLDEALSGLDRVTRARILRSPHLRGRTIVYAGHEEVFPDSIQGRDGTRA